MHEFIAKITRAAASKMAAFCYAVAVAVAGNVALHFVQPPDAAPTALASTAPGSAHVTAPPAAELAPAVTPSAVTPAAMTPPAAATTATTAGRPVAIKPVATAPILPVAPTIDLPNTAALPTPTLRATALPASHAPAPPTDTAALPEAPGPLTPVNPHVSFAPPGTPPATQPLALTPPNGAAASRTTVSLPLDPIGRPIDVAPVPNPPATALPTTPPPTALLLPNPPAPDVARAAKAEPGKTDKDPSLELSDLWHPSRAVRKSLNWADQQLPSFGGSDTTVAAHPAAHAPSVAAPISLLPSSADGGLQGGDKTEAAKPINPGPGSGGLY